MHRQHRISVNFFILAIVVLSAGPRFALCETIGTAGVLPEAGGEVPASAGGSVIQANPAFGGGVGRGPASLDPGLEEETAIESPAVRSMPGGTKIPLLLVLATLLVILVFWSSQPKPKKAPYVPKGKRPLPGQSPRDMH